MPRGDGTGPNGMGSMTGRGAGYCTGYTANNVGIRQGRGMGQGRGLRRMSSFSRAPLGARNDFNSPLQNGQILDEKTDLRNQEELLEIQLKQIKERLKGFEEEK